ncbi:hypothetical protein E4U41_001539 [Claviceps citrina]|nr:hypothetical protein E4U41_001539 [Claviceps citrina]
MAFKDYLGAIWVLFMASSIWIEGYATALVPSLFSYRAFGEEFGQQEPGQNDQLLLGIPWGWLQGIIVPYASEITMFHPFKEFIPVWSYAFWLYGQIMLAFVLDKSSWIENQKWSFRTPFLVQVGFLLPMAILAFKAPESPLHLVRSG